MIYVWAWNHQYEDHEKEAIDRSVKGKVSSVFRWLKKQFKLADISGDGFLNFDECMQLLDNLNLNFPREKAAELFKVIS